EQALDPLPPGAVILGDRNFGIFATAYAAHQRGHQVVIRLMIHRAKAIMGGPIAREGDYPVEWEAGGGDRAGKENRPTGAKIQVAWWQVGSGGARASSGCICSRP